MRFSAPSPEKKAGWSWSMRSSSGRCSTGCRLNRGWFRAVRPATPCSAWRASACRLGKLGDDEHGRFYRRKLRELGGSDEAFIATAEMPTGTCLSMITPDAERTMRTALGASLLLRTDEAEAVDFTKYDFVYIEGYMFF